MKTGFAVIILLFICFTAKSQQFDYSPGFDAGKPAEMTKLDFLEGKWRITLKYTREPVNPNPEWLPMGSSESTFSSHYDGTFIFEDSEGFPIGGQGHEGFSAWKYKSMFSFDRFQQKYRYVAFDNILGLADIYEGTFEDNTLILSNLKTSTYNNHGTNNSPQKNRITIKNMTEDRFELYWQTVDERLATGKSLSAVPWQWSVFMIYERVQ